MFWFKEIDMAPFRKLRTKLGLRKPAPKDTWPWQGIKIGRHSYGLKPSSVMFYSPTIDLQVGNFCSIAKEVVFLIKAQHPIDTASTFPLRTFARGTEYLGSKPIIVGHDVWIGFRSTIMSGVTLGNGSIVAAGSVVTKDVPPYAIVAGVPAKILRYRYDEKTIARMEEIAWWFWDDDKITSNIDAFDLPASEFVKGTLWH